MAWEICQSCATPADSPYSQVAADGQHWTYNDYIGVSGTDFNASLKPPPSAYPTLLRRNSRMGGRK